MSAYRDGLWINSAESGERLELALQLLEQNESVVVIEDIGVALRPETNTLYCEVIHSTAQNSIQSFQAEAELAK